MIFPSHLLQIKKNNNKYQEDLLLEKEKNMEKDNNVKLENQEIISFSLIKKKMKITTIEKKEILQENIVFPQNKEEYENENKKEQGLVILENFAKVTFKEKKQKFLTLQEEKKECEAFLSEFSKIMCQQYYEQISKEISNPYPIIDKNIFTKEDDEK